MSPIPPHTFAIPKLDGTDLKISLEVGQSIVFVGANGTGKTRLGVFIETSLLGASVHRITAQKNLDLADNLNLISLDRARKRLHYGDPDNGTQSTKFSYRWHRNPATHMLSDFEALLQVLFADHQSVASSYLRSSQTSPGGPPPMTRLNRLTAIWEHLLPHRRLEIDDGSVKVKVSAQPGKDAYLGSQMSDGERVIFYFLGQCLMAPANGIVIVDEPENHVHKGLLMALWDAIEQARADCAFIYITHDLDFAGGRVACTKYFLRSYDFDIPGKWEIDPLPESAGIPDALVAEVLGSRKPILFVEGERGSLDSTVYRNRYKNLTVVPVGSCEDVIHSVATFLNNPHLHWMQVYGLVDGDHRDPSEIAYLLGRGVHVLAVAEVENLLLLPNVFLALTEVFSCADAVAMVSNTGTVPQNVNYALKISYAKLLLDGLTDASSNMATPNCSPLSFDKGAVAAQDSTVMVIAQ